MAPLVGWGTRTAYLVLARPLTFEAGIGPCLILAPHPDDEALGCAGLILKLRGVGRRVIVVVVADGGGCQLSRFMPQSEVVALRQEETIEACTGLGVDRQDMLFLGVPDGTIVDHMDMITERIDAIVAATSPASIFGPHPRESHTDHRALGEIVGRLRTTRERGIPTFAYAVWLSPKTSLGLLFRRKSRKSLRSVAINRQIRDAKKTALECYKTQMPSVNGLETGGVLQQKFVSQFLDYDEVFFGSARCA